MASTPGQGKRGWNPYALLLAYFLSFIGGCLLVSQGVHLVYTRLVATPYCASVCSSHHSELKEVLRSPRKNASGACVCRDLSIESTVPDVGGWVGGLLFLGGWVALMLFLERRQPASGKPSREP